MRFRCLCSTLTLHVVRIVFCRESNGSVCGLLKVVAWWLGLKRLPKTVVLGAFQVPLELLKLLKLLNSCARVRACPKLRKMLHS